MRLLRLAAAAVALAARADAQTDCTRPDDTAGYVVTETELSVDVGFDVAAACATGYEGTGAAAGCATSGPYALSGCTEIVCTSPDATGYDVTEAELSVAAGFDVAAACATGYEGTGAAAACATSGPYTLSGCVPVVLCPNGGKSGFYEPCKEAIALIDAAGHAVIPSTYAAIGAFAFFRLGSTMRSVDGQIRAGLRSVALPSTLDIIGDSAFRGTALVSIEIPAVVSVGARAFYDCGALTTVTLTDSALTAPGIGESALIGTSITDWSFLGQAHVLCPESKYTHTACAAAIALIDQTSGDAVVPVGITTIGERAFYGRVDLLSVSLPAGLTVIGDYAFRGTGLGSVSGALVDIPSTVHYVGRQAFYDCKSDDLIGPQRYADLRQQSVAVQMLP